MPTKKQRKRELKAKRHEYETVWIDADGNELDEPPAEVLDKKERASTPKSAGTPTANKQPRRNARPRREPPAPSWNRAFKRAAMLGVVVFFLFSLTASKADNRYVAALIPAVIYTVMFVPFTYVIDRFAYRRYQAKLAQEGGATPRPAKKR